MSPNYSHQYNTDRDSHYGYGENFTDLEWESDLLERRRGATAHRNQPTNLSATIEQYMAESH